MENAEQITIKIKTMDEAIFEFKVQVTDKIKDLKMQIKDVRMNTVSPTGNNFWISILAHLTNLGPRHSSEEIENCIHGQTNQWWQYDWIIRN